MAAQPLRWRGGMPIADGYSASMRRTHAIIVTSCSLGLGACFLSDFDNAERRQAERLAGDSLVFVEGGSRAIDAGVRVSAEGGGTPAAGAGGAAVGGVVATAGHGAVGGVGGRLAAVSSGGAFAGRPAAAGSGGRASAAAGASGNGPAAVAGSGAAGCGDIRSDPEHCGRCDNDCSADMALASCVDARCVRACKAGYGDCNMDLAFGMAGDGCEVDLSADIAHCGGCGIRCAPPSGSVGYCEARQCKARAVEVGAPSPVAELHGNASGGDPYEEVCGRNEAMIGIDVASNGDYIWGLAVRCAAVQLDGPLDALTIGAGPAHALVLLGNRAEPMQTPMTLDCPTGTLVSSVSGATGYFGPDNTVFSVKTLSLVCARPLLSGSDIVLEPSSTQSAGSSMGNVAEPFSDDCAVGEVVTGFSGRAGHVLDALMTSCAPLQLIDRVQ